MKGCSLIIPFSEAKSVAVNPSSILSVWECTNLSPFKSEPPYSQEDEDELWEEVEASAMIVPIRGARRVLITGIVSGDKMLKELNDAVCSDLELQHFTVAQNFLNSSTIDNTEYEIYDEDGDVEGSVFAVDTPDGTVYYGNSDATHYAILE